MRGLTGHPWPLEGGWRLLEGRLGNRRVGEHCRLSLAVGMVGGGQHWSHHALVRRVALDLLHASNRAWRLHHTGVCHTRHLALYTNCVVLGRDTLDSHLFVVLGVAMQRVDRVGRGIRSVDSKRLLLLLLLG